MSEDSIKRKNLWASLGRIKFSDWEKMAEDFGFPVTKPSSGTSHCCIRKPTNPIDYSPKGLIVTIYPGMSKQVNGKVFKCVLKYCETKSISEDDLWKALGLL